MYIYICRHIYLYIYARRHTYMYITEIYSGDIQLGINRSKLNVSLYWRSVLSIDIEKKIAANTCEMLNIKRYIRTILIRFEM